VRPEIEARLLTLNREFYRRFASAFASKRARLQPGAARAIQRVQPDDSVLDLGCGHGLLAASLASGGHRGRYVGLDSSPELLDEARRSTRHPSAVFLLSDLADASWPRALEGEDRPPVHWAFALAVLHHLPGDELRRSVVQATRSRVLPGGHLVVSVWDFLASPRWKDRIVPWSEIDLSKSQLDPGDYLLDWREGGRGLRYVHHFTPESLSELGQSAGFHVEETFREDGEGGRLGLYQIWNVIRDR
jgi:tRNA (uracil-5-)-methyltransferase TRM9